MIILSSEKKWCMVVLTLIPCKWLLLDKPINLFTVTSPAMVIAITKRKKSRETNREKWEKALSRSQLTKFTLMSIYELWRKGLCKNGDQKAGQKAGLVSSRNMANNSQWVMGHPPEIHLYIVCLFVCLFVYLFFTLGPYS